MKLSFLLGAGVGYLLGARSGRQRYEQIMRIAHQIMENETVQSAAGTMQHEAFMLADKAKNTLGPKVGWHPNNDRVTISTTHDAHRTSSAMS